MEIAYYAGAADAAGTDREQVDTSDDMSAGDLVTLLSARHDGLAGVLGSCSLLVDGAPAKGPETRVPALSKVDVLPPFAGG
jgi:molybdopterin converting factor small subunit